MYVSRNKLTINLMLIICEVMAMIFISNECTYLTMTIISIIQLLLNIWCVAIFTKNSLFSFATIFLFLSWFFHCGQIVKIGLNIPGFVPLDVTKYANAFEIVQSFRFYYLMQLMVSVGMIMYSHSANKLVEEESYHHVFNASKTCRWLCIIGIVPRIYIDLTILINGFSNGYVGVYNLVIPQIVQTLAFFFDAGIIVALMDKSEGKKHTFLFWVILVYKCITMSTGARQERIAFLIIWILLYYFVLNDIKPRNIITLLILAFGGVLLINAIGNVRTSSDVSFAAIINSLSPDSDNNVIGDMLGEFGSALTTLASTVRNVPNQVSYGFGDAYLAGVLSIIPTLTNRLGLGNATAYVSKLQGATYFGGSYIGELYYNFSWVGIIGGVIIGRVVMSAQAHIYECKNHELTEKSVFAAIVMISMYLFVRGYFTDMVQRLVWIWLLLKLINDKRVRFVKTR